jgi:hypothetical protein
MAPSTTPLRRRRQGRPNLPRDEQKSELVTFRATPAMLAQLRESGRRHDRPLSHDIFHRLETSLRIFPDDNPRAQVGLTSPLVQALLGGGVVPPLAAPPRQEQTGAAPAAEPLAPEGAAGVAISAPGGPAAAVVVPPRDSPQHLGTLGEIFGRAAAAAKVSPGELQQLFGGNGLMLVEVLRNVLAADVREAVREALPELVDATVREIESGNRSSQQTHDPDVIPT